ncbi:hypothetical protein PS645_00434 [Pseudomonas fluorescens]|uniref:Uncharacterized protein n=1 Tax=Pseudomonas fluorescens TaxID=294 RepID=A0A5E6PPI3_PSEFL|nr:hypothetical protein PS645_00434 [Pseudomonas fluorescens]
MSPDGCRSEGTPSPSEGPDARGEPFFAYFFLAFEKKVSRRKGETASRRYRRNGYVFRQQEPGRPEGRLREQARSYRDLGTPRKSGWNEGRLREQARSYRDLGTPRKSGWNEGRFREQARSHRGLQDFRRPRRSLTCFLRHNLTLRQIPIQRLILRRSRIIPRHRPQPPLNPLRQQMPHRRLDRRQHT